MWFGKDVRELHLFQHNMCKITSQSKSPIKTNTLNYIYIYLFKLLLKI